MLIKFWGTRGSIPVPGSATVKYGGNTSCLEVELENSGSLILDAGTGIRKLGNRLLKEKRLQTVDLLFTHSHWDHIQGFPFFMPIYHQGIKIRIYSPRPFLDYLQKMLVKQMELGFFPLDFKDLDARLEFRELKPGPASIADAELSFLPCNHPGGAAAYKIIHNGKLMVFMTDNELSSPHPHTSWPEFTAFCRGADLLIHDAQYTSEELERNRTWGHSSHPEAVKLAREAQVKHLVLFHHDPERNDEQIEKILAECREIIEPGPLICTAAQEGVSIRL